MMAFKEHTLDIADHGRVEHLTYKGLLSFHQGEAIWGASVGFRAMQAAGLALSHEKLWDRNALSIVSAHPGPGVRDAIEFITRCVSRNRFRLLDPQQPLQCNQNMQFRWWATQNDNTVDVQLRKGFVPSHFFELVERVGSDQEKPADSQSLQTLKAELTERLWLEPLRILFYVTNSTKSTAQDMPQCTN